MSSREEVLRSFIEKLAVIFPELIAVYEFKKEIALFDSIIQNRKGLVVIVTEEDYSLENLILVDLVYDKIQDEFGWKEGVFLANSFSRSYIRTKHNLWYINIKNNHCLLPEDQINLKNTRKLIYGIDILPTLPFPHNETEIKKINIGFSRLDALEIKEKYQQYTPLVDPECCWMRFDFTINHSLIQILSPTLRRIKDGIKPEKNAHIYGRFGGSGKTQISYLLMKKCKELKIPFIYRTEFWKGEDGKYLTEEFNSENSSEKVTQWIVDETPSHQLIIFLDEVDVDLKLLREKLKLKYPKEDINFLVISSGKDIPSYVDDSFEVYDITKEYTYSESQYKTLIEHLIKISNLPENVFSKEIINQIIKKTRIWNLSSFRTSPTAVILACSLALDETLKYAEVNEKIVISKETAEKWSLLGTSPWFQKYNESHDVHAEYLIFDGKKYVATDKHYHHPLP